MRGCKERVNGQDTMRQRRGAAGPFMFTNRGERRRREEKRREERKEKREERSRKEGKGEERRREGLGPSG